MQERRSPKAPRAVAGGVYEALVSRRRVWGDLSWINATRTNGMLATAGRTKYFEDLEVGQEASMSRIVSDADIVAYAALSGD